MAAWLLGWILLVAPAAPSATAAVPGLVDVVVAARDDGDGSLAALWVSNRSGVHERGLEGTLERGIRIVVGPSRGEPRLLGGKLGAIEERSGSESTSGNAAATQALLEWMRGQPQAAGAVSGIVRRDGLAVWQGVACSGCEVHRGERVLVLTRGVPAGVAAAIGRRMGTGATGVRELLRLCSDLVQHWPSRIPMRSAVVVGFREDRAPEQLVVGDDARGQAPAALPRLHLRHLGDVELDHQLARARSLIALGENARSRHAIAMAIWAGRAALQYDPKEPLWRAKLALALALQPGIDDAALRELDRALSLAPTMPEVRMIAAEVLALRGDVSGARFQLATALRLVPDDAEILAAMQRLGP